MSSYTIPNVIATHPRGDRIMDVYSHLLTERIVYLGTAIDAGVANALIAQLLHLEADSPGREIAMYINCEGGDPAAMLGLRHDAVRAVADRDNLCRTGNRDRGGTAGGRRRGPTCCAPARPSRSASARRAGPGHHS